jgi:hypothetical protein
MFAVSLRWLGPDRWKARIDDRSRWRRRGGRTVLATAIALYAAMLVVALVIGHEPYALFFGAVLTAVSALGVRETTRG